MTNHQAGRAGGRARAKSLSPERRREIAQQAIAARWSKRKAPAYTHDFMYPSGTPQLEKVIIEPQAEPMSVTFDPPSELLCFLCRKLKGPGPDRCQGHRGERP